MAPSKEHRNLFIGAYLMILDFLFMRYLICVGKCIKSLSNKCYKLFGSNVLECILCKVTKQSCLNYRQSRTLAVFFCAFLLLSSTQVLGQVTIDLNIIAQIESGNRPLIGDGDKAFGHFQLHQAVVTDYNKAHNTSYLLKDCLQRTIAERVASWYLQVEIPRLLRHFKLSDTIDNRIVAYNAGITALLRNKIPKITQQYIKKYHKLEGSPR